MLFTVLIFLPLRLMLVICLKDYMNVKGKKNYLQLIMFSFLFFFNGQILTYQCPFLATAEVVKFFFSHDLFFSHISVFLCGSAGKESTCNAGDLGLIPGLGRSPGEGKGYPLQYSGLENSIDYIVHGVAKSRTQLSNFHYHIAVI